MKEKQYSNMKNPELPAAQSSLIDAMNWRYATRRMTGALVPQEKLDRILEATRLSPSSYGLQPYTILVIGDPELRNKIRRAANYQPQIVEASHLLVFAAWDSIDPKRIDEFIYHVAETRGVP